MNPPELLTAPITLMPADAVNQHLQRLEVKIDELTKLIAANEKKKPALPPRLTVNEAAAFVGCHPRTLRRHIALGRVRTVRLATGGSSRVMVDRESLEALLALGGQ